MSLSRWLRLSVVSALCLLVSCGGVSTDGDLSAEDFWVCVGASDLGTDYEAIVNAAMVERSDGQGRDLRSIVRSIRVDRNIGAVQLQIDSGSAVMRDEFAHELLSLQAVAGLQRTSGGTFDGCSQLVTGQT